MGDLTTLFGMGRGVTPATKTPEFKKFKLKRSAYERSYKFIDAESMCIQKRIGKSHELLVLLDSHITVFISVAYQPSHLLGILVPEGTGNLILGRVSHLDAFSAYRCRTWLPSNAVGTTTGTPEVSPLRSSRTRSSSSQIPYAHSG